MRITKRAFIKFLSLISVLLFNLTLSESALGIQNQDKADDGKFNKLLSSIERSNFSISAKIFYGDEDETEIPVKANFYLLDKSLIEILKEAKFNPVDENASLITDEIYLEALAKLLTDPEGDEDDLLNFLFWDRVNKHKISSLETDYFGYAKSTQIKSGNYYLFGYAEVDDEIFIWNHPVYLSGKRIIEIDQNNAEIVLPADF